MNAQGGFKDRAAVPADFYPALQELEEQEVESEAPLLALASAFGLTVIREGAEPPR